MMNEKDTENSMLDLMQFHGIERKLSATKDFETDTDGDMEYLFSTLIEPYCPFGIDGPRVTMQSAISLVNRLEKSLSVVRTYR